MYLIYKIRDLHRNNLHRNFNFFCFKQTLNGLYFSFICPISNYNLFYSKFLVEIVLEIKLIKKDIF